MDSRIQMHGVLLLTEFGTCDTVTHDTAAVHYAMCTTNISILITTMAVTDEFYDTNYTGCVFIDATNCTDIDHLISLLVLITKLVNILG